MSAESLLLAACATDPQSLATARAWGLAESDWWNPSHRAIWRAACEAQAAGDLSLGRVRLGAGGGAARVCLDLADWVQPGGLSVDAVELACARVRRSTQARSGAAAAEAAATQLRTWGRVEPEVAEALQVALTPGDPASGRGPAWGELVECAAQPDSAEPVPTGLPDLDEQLSGGWHRGTLNLIAARPSVGKSMLALNIALRAAARGHSVVFASLEVAPLDLGRNALAACAGVDTSRQRRGWLDELERGRVDGVRPRVAELPMRALDRPGVALAELVGELEGLAPELAVVDYLQLVRCPGHRGTRAEQVAEISAALKALSRRLGAPVVALSQLNRTPAQRGAGRPRLSDLRDSGALEQDADVVVLLRRPRPGEAGAGYRLLADVAKHRHGPVGEVSLRVWPPCQLVG